MQFVQRQQQSDSGGVASEEEKKKRKNERCAVCKCVNIGSAVWQNKHTIVRFASNRYTIDLAHIHGGYVYILRAYNTYIQSLNEKKRWNTHIHTRTHRILSQNMKIN